MAVIGWCTVRHSAGASDDSLIATEQTVRSVDVPQKLNLCKSIVAVIFNFSRIGGASDEATHCATASAPLSNGVLKVD